MVDVVDELFDQIFNEDVVLAEGVVGVEKRPEWFGDQFQYRARNDCSNQNGNQDILGENRLRLMLRSKTEISLAKTTCSGRNSYSLSNSTG